MVNDPKEKNELSSKKRELFLSLKEKLINKYREVNQEREQTASDIAKKVDQLN